MLASSGYSRKAKYLSVPAGQMKSILARGKVFERARWLDDRRATLTSWAGARQQLGYRGKAKYLFERAQKLLVFEHAR